MQGNHTNLDVLEDALISAGSASVGILAAAYGVSGALPSTAILYGALLAFGASFFVSLGVARRRPKG